MLINNNNHMLVYKSPIL